jgi:hypothetical protein
VKDEGDFAVEPGSSMYLPCACPWEADAFSLSSIGESAAARYLRTRDAANDTRAETPIEERMK